MCKDRKHYDFTNLPDTFASDYSPLRSTNADGTVTIRPASRCKRCQADVKAKRYQRLTDEERRERTRKANEQRDQAARREYSRLYDEMRRREAGVKPRPFKDGRNRQPVISVDAAPVAKFLERRTRTGQAQVGTSQVNMGTNQLPAISEVAEVIGLNSNFLWHIRCGHPKTVELRVADKILTFFDAQHLLVEWYPEA